MPSNDPTPCNVIAPQREFEDRYGGFVLSYRPQPTPEGRFLAYVIVSRHFGFVQTCAAVTPDLSSFESVEEAAQAGRYAGRRWVDAHAQADAQAPRSTRPGKSQARFETQTAARAGVHRQHA